jgi:hypothetical protein
LSDLTRRPGRRLLVSVAVAALVTGGWFFYKHGRSVWVSWVRPFTGARSVEGVVSALDGTAGARVREALSRAGVPPRPAQLWLLAVKDERRLELWASNSSGERVRATSWPVLAASGAEGPKLREGDRQVPEGIYQIEGLNPNSAYHLSLKVGYPNSSDRAWAARDGRTRLGGDIFIHGKDVSIGCLAIGDAAIEELFWLAGTVGRDAFHVVIVPTDLRRKPAPNVAVAWAPELYGTLKTELAHFPMR